jgi:hypothetical protein
MCISRVVRFLLVRDTPISLLPDAWDLFMYVPVCILGADTQLSRYLAIHVSIRIRTYGGSRSTVPIIRTTQTHESPVVIFLTRRHDAESATRHRAISSPRAVV